MQWGNPICKDEMEIVGIHIRYHHAHNSTYHKSDAENIFLLVQLCRREKHDEQVP